MNLFEVMKIAIVIASIYACITQTWQATKMIRYNMPSSWVHIGLGILSLYWGLYYLRSVLGFAPFNMHQVYVRAPILLTLVFLGAAGAYAIRRYK